MEIFFELCTSVVARTRFGLTPPKDKAANSNVELRAAIEQWRTNHPDLAA